MRQATKRTDQLLPIATLGTNPLVPDGCRLTVKVSGAHSVVSLICPTSACPVQAQEVFTNLESRLLLTLLAFPDGCARPLLLAVVRLSAQEWHALCEDLLAQFAGTPACPGDSSSWERVCIDSTVLTVEGTKEEECRSLWDALTTLRRKLRPFSLLIPTYEWHRGYRLLALRNSSDDHEQAGEFVL